MKLQDQVCDLQQAKHLKELGVVQESYFIWKCNSKQDVIISTPLAFAIKTFVPPIGNKYYSAYTVAELGVISSPYVYGHSFYNEIGKTDGKYWAHTWRCTLGAGPLLGWFPTEAQARAAMLIHLLETNLITTDEVNQRLTS